MAACVRTKDVLLLSSRLLLPGVAPTVAFPTTVGRRCGDRYTALRGGSSGRVFWLLSAHIGWDADQSHPFDLR